MSIKKTRQSKGKTLTPKEAKFTREYVKTLNGTKSALAVYDVKGTPAQRAKTASVISAENLSKPRVKSEIERLMRENDVDINDVVSIHKRNMLQEKHLPTSQKAVDTFYTLLGMTDTEKKTNVNVAFIIEKDT